MSHRDWCVRVHDEIIEMASFRKLTRQEVRGECLDFELHHIIPRSIGGRLTYREHFLVHWLLTKIHSGNARKKMCRAMIVMVGDNGKRKITPSAWQFALARECARRVSRGKKHSDETKRKMSENRRGSKMSPLHIAATRRTGSRHSDDTKQKIATSRSGRKHSEETIRKMKEAWVRRKAA